MAPALERRRRNRRRERSAQIAVLVFAVLAGAIAAVAGSPRGESATGPVPARTTTTLRAAPVLPAGTLLFGHYGPNRRVDLIVGFGWNRGARQGTVLLIPATTMVEVPSLGPQALADVRRLASPQLLEVVAENMLGIGFDGSMFLTDAQLSSVLAPAGKMTVDFPRATRIDDDAGTRSFRAGRQLIDPADAMRLLVATGHDELSHLVTVGAVLDGWRAALARSAVASATVKADPRLLPLVMARHAKMDDSTLPVERVSSGGEERFRIRTSDAKDIVDRSFPWALITRGTRPRVEVLNGVGGVGVTQKVALRVVPAGGEVTLTGNVAGFGVSTTRVVYYRQNGRAAAQRMVAALGVGKVERATNAIDVVDLTIVVGKDFGAPPR